MRYTKVPTVPINVRLPEPMHEQLRAMNEISISDHVRLALAAYLDTTVRPQSAFVNPQAKRTNGQK